MNQGTKWFVAAFLAVFTALMGASLTADEVTVHLENGDRLKGVLISEGDTIAIRHSLLGEVTIRKESISRLERGSEANEAKASAGAVKARPSGNPKPDRANAEQAKEPSAGKQADTFVEPKQSWTRAAIQALTFENWTRQFEFGMNNQRGRRIKEDYSLRYTMRRRIDKNDFRFLAQKFYGETDDDVTSDRTLSSFRWRKDISPGAFYQTDTIYSADAVKEIDLSLQQKLGLGYRFVDRKDLKVNTGLGLSSRYRDDTRGNNSDYLLSLFEDVDYRLSPRFRLTQDFGISLPPENHEEYEIEFQTGVVSKLSESLHMSVRYQLQYDRSQPRDRREDQRFVSSIGFDF
ncbi:MAG: hypothetical protein CBD18_03785 [Opitutales bacterium TMED158]|nr:MAG: hypothetical protein CBD18_03785 [Opitutales bacterium TMED158]